MARHLELARIVMFRAPSDFKDHKKATEDFLLGKKAFFADKKADRAPFLAPGGFC